MKHLYKHSGMCVGKEPSLNLNGVSALSLLQSSLCTCISAVTGVRGQVWNFPLPSVKPAQKVSASRFSDWEAWLLPSIPYPHREPDFGAHRNPKQQHTMSIFQGWDRLMAGREWRERTGLPCVFNTKHISVTDLNYTIAGYTQAAQINQSIRRW